MNPEEPWASDTAQDSTTTATISATPVQRLIFRPPRIAVGLMVGWPWTIAVITVSPLLGLLTYSFRDMWEDACLDVRRYVALRRRSDLRTWLLELRRELAESLEHLRQQGETE